MVSGSAAGVWLAVGCAGAMAFLTPLFGGSGLLFLVPGIVVGALGVLLAKPRSEVEGTTRLAIRRDRIELGDRSWPVASLVGAEVVRARRETRLVLEQRDGTRSVLLTLAPTDRRADELAALVNRVCIDRGGHHEIPPPLRVLQDAR